MAELNEKQLTTYLVRMCSLNDVLCRKITYQGKVGAPDWMLAYGGKIYFVELKGLGEKPSKAQLNEINALREKGINATWVDSSKEIDHVITYLKEV